MDLGFIFSFLIFILFLIAWVIIANKMEQVAKLKGYQNNESHAFLMCLFLGAIGWLYISMLPDKIAQQKDRLLIEMLSKNKK